LRYEKGSYNIKNNPSNVKLLQFGLTLILGMVCSNGCSNTNVPGNSQDSILNTPFSIRSAMSIAIRKADIASQYGKPDVTRKQKDYAYEIRILSDGSKFFVIYGSDDIVNDEWRLNKLLARSDFEKIVAGKSVVGDVKKMDPYFQLFEYSDDKNAAISEHRLNDGGLLTIGYKKVGNEWVVDSLTYKDQDPSGFASKILPEDK